MSASSRMPEALEGLGFLRLKQVLSLYPVSSSTWWKGVREGRFPAPISLGSNTTAWRAADIRELLVRVAGGEK